MFYLILGFTAVTLVMLKVSPRIAELMKLNLGISLDLLKFTPTGKVQALHRNLNLGVSPPKKPTPTVSMLAPRRNLNQIAFSIFDFITSLYTYCRLTVEPYHPFKPRLQLYTIGYYFDYVRKPENKEIDSCRGTSECRGWLMAHDPMTLRDRIVEASKYLGETRPVALSIVYSFSDWNEKYIKLIDLRCSTSTPNQVIDSISKLMEQSMPDYNPLNYDYNVTIETIKTVETIETSESDLFREGDKAIVTANLEAYLRRASTWEAEQALRLLSERPELMEFLYEFSEVQDAKIMSTFHRGLFSFVASDELGTEFDIRVNTP